MKYLFSIFFLLFIFSVTAQEKSKAIKIIPQASMKIGSQQPAVGGQFDLVAGIIFQNNFFAGIGVGYTTNMGMGGSTIPLYFDGRYYFSLPNNFLFRSKDQKNNFQADLQIGMDINNNTPFKTGFLAGIGLAYLFDFVKIKEFNFPAFYLGFNIEYNATKLYDEYRGYTIIDGKLVQTMFNVKLAFDINPISAKFLNKKQSNQL